uniref:Phosphoglycolate phosphatase n=1 Tax=Chenopodium quinoa TaxID=63459 RepID=A0A803M1H2_CHEQI
MKDKNKSEKKEQEMGSSSTEVLNGENGASLLNSVDAFLFDCDGVIWKGDKLIDGVSETLQFLRSQVYVIGGEGIVEELHLAGFTSLGGPDDANKKIELKQNPFFHHDKTVGAVVVGLDQYINFYKLQYATLCIRENPGCLFIATNRDAVGHMTDLQEWPGAGCMVAAVCGTTQKEPVVVGKPSTFMMDFLLKKFNVDTSRMCMVGDRLDTDILFGQSAGCKTLLVLSGVTSLPALQDSANNIVPDYYTDKVSDLLQLLGP